MKIASLLGSSATFLPGGHRVGFSSTHSARYRLKSYLQTRRRAWAAVALAQGADADGATELPEDAREPSPPR